MKKYTLILSVSVLAFGPVHGAWAQSSSDANAAEQFIEEFLEQSDPVVRPPNQVDVPELTDVQDDVDVSIVSEMEEAEEVLLPVPAREDSVEAVAPSTPVAATPVTITEVREAQPVPPQDDLSTVQPIVTGGQVINNIAPPSEGKLSIPDLPETVQIPNPDEGLFFDSEASVSSSQQTGISIRNVSPRVEPASKYVVVSKGHAGNSTKAKIVSAQRALKLGRYESALDIYNQLYAKNSQNQNVLMGRAVALQKLGRDDAAVQAYEELLDANPNNVTASINMVGIIGQRYPAVASRRLIELKNKNPNNVAVLAQLAIIEGNVGRYDEALRYLGIASGMQPKNAGHLYNMAVISDRAGDTKKAVEYYEQALEIDAIHGGNRSVPRESIFARLSQIR